MRNESHRSLASRESWNENLPLKPGNRLPRRKIREAQTRGCLRRASRLRQTDPDLAGPDDPNWWIKKKLREEKLVLLPPILEARLDAERTLESVARMLTEGQVRRALAALNERIRRAHFSPADGPPGGVQPVDVEAIVTRWKSGRIDS